MDRNAEATEGRQSPVKTNVFRPGQLQRLNGAPLAIAPDDTTVKCTFGTVSRWCRNRIQNDEIIEPIRPLTKHENECLNMRSSHGGPRCDTVLYPGTHPYLYPNGTDVLSSIRRLLKKEIRYILSSCSENIDTVPLPSSWA